MILLCQKIYIGIFSIIQNIIMGQLDAWRFQITSNIFLLFMTHKSVYHLYETSQPRRTYVARFGCVRLPYNTANFLTALIIRAILLSTPTGGGERMLHSTQKIALSGWLQKNGEQECRSALKLQKFLFFYETICKAHSESCDFSGLKRMKTVLF